MIDVFRGDNELNTLAFGYGYCVRCKRKSAGADFDLSLRGRIAKWSGAAER